MFRVFDETITNACSFGTGRMANCPPIEAVYMRPDHSFGTNIVLVRCTAWRVEDTFRRVVQAVCRIRRLTGNMVARAESAQQKSDQTYVRLGYTK